MNLFTALRAGSSLSDEILNNSRTGMPLHVPSRTDHWSPDRSKGWLNVGPYHALTHSFFGRVLFSVCAGILLVLETTRALAGPVYAGVDVDLCPR